MTVTAHDNNLVEAALAYARLGYAVFPCRPGGKPPATPHGCKDATTDEACIRAWWDRQSDANIGLATHGLLVVDIDGPENPWLADQPDRQRDLYAAPVSLTTGGGRHHLFRQPSGRTWGNSCGRLAPKVDTRGNGGYIIVPPSVVDGRAYRWASGSLTASPAALPEPPPWLADMLDNGRAETCAPMLRQVEDVEARALAYLAQMPPAVSDQGGHNATYAAATALVHGFGLTADRALALLLAHYNPRCQPPWSEKELRHKVAEAAAKPHDRPHGWLRDQGAPISVPHVDTSALEAQARAAGPTEAAPVLTPLAIDLQTFAETPEREIVWLWEGVIPRGMLSLIGGKQGLGKSFLVCDIAARISTGSPMPDGVGNAPGNVLLLAREDDASCVLLPRLKAAQADLGRIWWSLFANANTDEPLDLAAHVGLLVGTVAEKGIDLVVVDTFASFAPVGTKSNEGQDVRLLLDALTRLARKTGAAVVVVTHLRKSGQGESDDPMDAIAGSHQMTAGVRVAAMLDKGPNDGERWFRVVKSNLGRIDERGWTWRFAWPDPFSEGAAGMPHLEWATAGDEVMARGRTPSGCDLEAVRSALVDLLADGPRSRREACGRVAAVLRQTQSHVRIDDVALAIDRIVRDGDGVVQTWDGPRNAQMIGLPGSRPEDPEDKALRLASENPSLTVRELRALAGCRRDVAMLALRAVRDDSEGGES